MFLKIEPVTGATPVPKSTASCRSPSPSSLYMGHEGSITKVMDLIGGWPPERTWLLPDGGCAGSHGRTPVFWHMRWFVKILRMVDEPFNVAKTSR